MDHAPSQSGFLFRLALIIDGAYRAVAAHIAHDRTAGPTIVAVCNDLRRRFFRFARLVERVQLGILPRTRLQPSGSGPRLAPNPAPNTGKVAARLPRGRGALVKMMQQAPWTVAVYGSLLNAWMADPEVASLLASYPQGRRILRPMWRMVSADKLPELLREPEPERPASAVTRPIADDVGRRPAVHGSNEFALPAYAPRPPRVGAATEAAWRAARAPSWRRQRE